MHPYAEYIFWGLVVLLGILILAAPWIFSRGTRKSPMEKALYSDPDNEGE